MLHHPWREFYAPRFGSVEHFMQSHQEVFVQRPDGAFYVRAQPQAPGLPPPIGEAVPRALHALHTNLLHALDYSVMQVLSNKP